MNLITRSHIASGLVLTGLLAVTPLAMAGLSSVAHADDYATPQQAPQGQQMQDSQQAPQAQSAPDAQGAQGAQVGSKAPDFTLTDTDGKSYTLSQVLAGGKTVVLEWFNPDCPFIKRHHVQDKDMTRIYDQYKDRGVVWFAINSGAPGAQGAGLERNIKAKADYQIDYPILMDQSGAVGLAYGAKTTPHMFVIRKDGVLVYSGAIDDDPRGEKKDRVNYVQAALTACAAGGDVATAQTKSYGCSVKYGMVKKS